MTDVKSTVSAERDVFLINLAIEIEKFFILQNKPLIGERLQLIDLIDKHTARLTVPEPSDEDKRQIAGLEALAAKRDKRSMELWHWAVQLQKEKAELVERLEDAIASGPMKINPSPETFKSVEALPEATLVDFRMSVCTYIRIKAAIANATEKQKEESNGTDTNRNS